MTLRYVVKQGPAFVRSSPFGSLTESYFEQGETVQALESVTLEGHVSGREAVWAHLASGLWVCIDDGETTFLVPILGAIPAHDPPELAQTKPLTGMYVKKDERLQ